MGISTIVDVVAVVAFILSGWAGWRLGLLSSAMSFGSLVAGVWVAATYTPVVLDHFDVSGMTRTIASIASIVVFSLACQALASQLAAGLREKITWNPVKILDSVVGAGVAVFCTAGALLLIQSSAPMLPNQTLTRAVRTSTVLKAIDRVVPDTVQYSTKDVQALIDSPDFPRAFRELRAPVPEVAVPPKSVAGTRAVKMADYIIRVQGESPKCSSRVMGSGFVVSRRHVLTNAHVVAGMQTVTVRQGRQRDDLAAVVVYFDPVIDVAVLYVPALEQRAVYWDSSVNEGETAVIAGYPDGGPLAFKPARVSARITTVGEDIYGNPAPTRSIWAFRGEVMHGNSGGPLLSRDGKAMALIFASSDKSNEIGYAIPQDQLSKAMRAAQQATEPVDTRSCRTR